MRGRRRFRGRGHDGIKRSGGSLDFLLRMRYRLGGKGERITGSLGADSTDVVPSTSGAGAGIAMARAAVAKRRKVRLLNCILAVVIGFEREVSSRSLQRLDEMR